MFPLYVFDGNITGGAPMDWDGLFATANAAALPGWAIVLLAPRGGRWRLLGLAPRIAIPLVLSALYSGLMLGHLVTAGGGFDSIRAVRHLFASDPVLVAGWLHYLAFDLLVGVALADRMDRADVARWVQMPVLGLVFLAGPVGLLLGLAAEAGARMRGARPQALERSPA